MLTLAFNIQPVKASGTIYIRADGSIDPPTAPISTVDTITYTFTGDINDESIVIERDNIVVDGAGCLVQGTGGGTGITLSGRSNVTIKNTEITTFYYGIYLEYSSDNSIVGNNITRNGMGIELDYSSNYNNIFGNNITNMAYGMALVRSLGNSVSGNNITDNNYGGYSIYLGGSSSGSNISGNNITNNGPILLDGSSGNSVSGNNMTANNGWIWLGSASNNIISGNNIADNNGYIRLDGYSSNNTISGNNITDSSEAGIWFGSASYNIISGNNITDNNYYGIFLGYSSDNNIIFGNNITANNGYGIYLDSSTSYSSYNSIFHNNFINNTNQVYSTSDSVNVWDDGYPSGGNYWSDYSGVDLYSGPYQNFTGNDGKGDTPYVIDANNKDQYPLMTPFIGVHDIAATSVMPSTTVVGQGYSLNINVTVTNQGPFEETFNVTCYYVTHEMWDVFWSFGDATMDGRINQADIDFMIANFNWNGPPGGNRADVTGAQGVPDGTVNMRDISWCILHQGWTIWTYYHSGAVIGRAVNINLTAESYTTVAVTWNTTGLALGNYSIGAYAEPVDNETDLDDNTLGDVWVTVTVPGDINADFIVDIYDAILLAGAYNSVLTSPNWKPNADINGDKTVDIYDAILLANHYNQHYP